MYTIELYLWHIGFYFVLMMCIYIAFVYFRHRNRMINTDTEIYESVIKQLKSSKGTEKSWISETLLKAEIMEETNRSDREKRYIWEWIYTRSRKDKRIRIQPRTIDYEQIVTWTYSEY